MKFYRYENGVIAGGPYNCDQNFQVAELADDNAQVVAFNKPSVPLLIARLEAEQPITQRAIRELMLVIGQAFPAAQASVFYQRAAAQDEAVSALMSQSTVAKEA